MVDWCGKLKADCIGELSKKKETDEKKKLIAHTVSNRLRERDRKENERKKGEKNCTGNPATATKKNLSGM